MRKTAVVLGLFVVAAMGSKGGAQRAPYQPVAADAGKPGAAAASGTRLPLMQIYVDARCRLLPDPATVKPGEKIRTRRDWSVCHLETVNASHHREERVVGNELERSYIEVREQEYVMQDIYPQPVAFLVEQPVGAGWTIDSDPSPVRAQGDMAVFQAIAQPGEIVRLHVGMRHTEALKPVALRPVKPTKAAPSGPPPGSAATQPGS